jgi:UDP-glucose 4-epimerase
VIDPSKHTILVTGGAGFIGSHTAITLIEQGFHVIIADNLNNSRIDSLDWIEQITKVRPVFYQLDCCDYKAVEALFEKEPGISATIHFAALKAVGESVENPLRYYRNNLVSMLNLLEIQQKAGVNSLVFSSSCTVYGEPDALPVTEDTPVKMAESPYGNTKQIGEEILRDFCKAMQFQAIALRYFNPVGAHHSGIIGELPLGKPNNLVPFITQTAAGFFPSLSVFGNDYNTPDGTCIRDYIHVEDVAEAHVTALKRLITKQQTQAYEVFNIGTGKGYSVLEVIQSFEKTSGQKLPYQIVPRRAGDIEKVYADTSKSNTVLGWKALKGLDEMMASAWLWQQNLSNKHIKL